MNGFFMGKIESKSYVNMKTSSEIYDWIDIWSKVFDIILSCRTIKHIEVSKRVLENYKKLYGKSVVLESLIDEKSKLIN